MWAGPAVIVAALLTGILLSHGSGSLGKIYLACFIVSTVVVATITQARGLLLVVAGIPIVFVGMTFAATLFFGWQAAPTGSGITITTLVTSAYPVIQFFPTLVWTTLAAAVISAVRVWLLKRNLARYQKATSKERLQVAEADRRNQESVHRMRQFTASDQPTAVLPRVPSPGDSGAQASPLTPGAPLSAPTPRPQPKPKFAAADPALTARERRQRQAEKRREALRAAQVEAARSGGSGRRHARPGDPSRVTVEELLARAGERKSRSPRRSDLHKDLYEDN